MRKQFATSLDESLIKELKVYAAENDQPINTVIENALNLWLAIAKDKGFQEVADCMHTSSRTGSKLQQYAYEQINLK